MLRGEPDLPIQVCSALAGIIIEFGSNGMAVLFGALLVRSS